MFEAKVFDPYLIIYFKIKNYCYNGLPLQTPVHLSTWYPIVPIRPWNEDLRGSIPGDRRAWWRCKSTISTGRNGFTWLLNVMCISCKASTEHNIFSIWLNIFKLTLNADQIIINNNATITRLLEEEEMISTLNESRKPRSNYLKMKVNEQFLWSILINSLKGKQVYILHISLIKLRSIHFYANINKTRNIITWLK